MIKLLLQSLKVKWSWFKHNLTQDKDYSLKYDISHVFHSVHKDYDGLKIHHVIIKKKFYHIEINLYLEHPGIFIGKGGSKINEATSLLEHKLKSNVKIKVSPYTPLPFPY